MVPLSWKANYKTKQGMCVEIIFERISNKKLNEVYASIFIQFMYY